MLRYTPRALGRSLVAPTQQSPLTRIAQASYRFASSSSSSAVPPPPNSKASQSKLSKAIKPSSKVNARTSRLLRSQLAPASVAQGTSDAEAAEAAALADDEYAQANIAESRGAGGPSTTTSAAAVPPQLQEVLAFATASSYDFAALINSGRLPQGWRLMEDGQVIYLPSWPAHHHPHTHGKPGRSASGEVFILRTGAYITWGLNAEQAQRFRGSVLSPRGAVQTASQPLIEKEPYEDLGEEEMEFIVNEQDVTRIVGDVLILGQAPPDVDSSSDPWSPLLARLSFSAGLALSARLSSQEASLSEYLSSVSTLPLLLEQKGRVPISRKDVVRKMGRLLKLRQMVNLEEGSKVEELELFWENGRMEEHYDSICQTLDIEQRFRALNEQLDHAENLMGVLRALLTEGSSHRMEVIIIALIAIEVTLALISHGYLSNPFAEPAVGDIVPHAHTHTLADASAIKATTTEHAV